MNAQLSLHNLTRHYPGTETPAVASFELTVEPGSCVALIGPSGSGKTTVLRLATGLERPDSGDVRVDGRSVLTVPPEHRGMAMVFQRPLLFPHRNVLDNVAFAARVRGTPRRQARAEAQEYLELVRLSELGTRRPTELSGGQQQRVAVARALAARPRVLMLDEPFSALDAPLREEMHELVRQIRAALEPTIVLVTHDQAEAAALADEVAVLSAGRLAQHDTLDQVYARPRSLLVARQMGGRNEVPGEVRGHHHHSVLGSVALPVDVRSLPGAAVLVFRQESVIVTGPDDADADFSGTVTAVRPIGPRRLLSIAPIPAGVTSEAQDDLRIHAETAPGRRVSRGDSVGVILSPHALTVVPPDATSPGPARPRKEPGHVAEPTRAAESVR